ncbi:hypothetical protein HC891_13965, partial [Candidatus Gracilibacteria bacterium]|nr:hypothetical protein [Candidatus Gracilibacteria bacterium]
MYPFARLFPLHNRGRFDLRRLLLLLVIVPLLPLPIQPVAAALTFVIIDDSTDNVGQYTSLALTSDQRPVISYHDFTNRDLKLAVCDTPACVNPT